MSRLGGRSRHAKKTRKTGKSRRSSRKMVRMTKKKLRGRGLFDMFSSKPKKVNPALATGYVPAQMVVAKIDSTVNNGSNALVSRIDVSDVQDYQAGVALLVEITGIGKSGGTAYKLAKALQDDGVVAIGDKTGEYDQEFQSDDLVDGAAELKTAFSRYKPETGEVV